jgi:divalent metal cation (Fe/Co/Zn/Cd) transporter
LQQLLLEALQCGPKHFIPFPIHLIRYYFSLESKISTKAASERHTFGYGKEQFFWSFIVATMIFGISGILSLEQGIGSIFGKGHHIENVDVSYIILAISAFFEANALRVALTFSKKAIRSRRE